MIAKVVVNPATIRSRPRLPCYCTFCIMILQVYANYVYLFFAVVIIVVSVVLMVLCIVVMIAYCRRQNRFTLINIMVVFINTREKVCHILTKYIYYGMN
jgi:hypothetical protein